jgi:hypothetical protein
MIGIPTWEVDLFVDGPVTVKGRIRLNEPKSFQLKDLFYSDIELWSMSFGVGVTVTAFASTRQLARKAAIFFFGQMLDALTIRVNLPIQLSEYERQFRGHSESHSERRIVEVEEWRTAFREARILAYLHPTFMRALGWYRKGLRAEDAFDRFLAFWNSIEIVASKYHPDTKRTKAGSKDQIWECFDTLWGECDQWPIIAGNESWVKENYEIRKNIAHGVASIDVETVELVVEKLETIEHVSHIFLVEWYTKQLNLTVPKELEWLVSGDQ